MRPVLLGLLLALGLGTIRAQTPQSANTVTIAVSDVTGAIITFAEVVVRHTGEAAVTSSNLDKAGEAHFLLPHGSFEVTVNAPGFKTMNKRAQVTGSPSQHFPLTLQADPLTCGPCVTPQADGSPHTVTAMTITAVDPWGARIAKAKVVVKSTTDSAESRFTADAAGEVRLSLQHGSYEVQVDSMGFVQSTKHIEVAESEPQQITVVLQIGGCPPSPCVTVEPVTSH